MNESPIADQHGAVDLSSVGGGQQSPAAHEQQAAALPAQQGAPAQGGVPAGIHPGVPAGAAAATPGSTLPDASGMTVSAPLTVDVTEQNFEEVMALSQTVPVILVLYAPKSLASKNAVDVLEGVAREDAGAFQLGRVNVETNPTLAEAFQAQTVPAGYAIIGRRPVPLFEGVPTETQLRELLTELFQVAAQLGVTGRLEVSDADRERPVPEEHLPARSAEETGDWESAISAWKKVLANNPGDREAKTALVRAQFQARQEDTAEEDQAEGATATAREADAMFARGQESQAFDLLLESMAASQDAEQKEQLRLRLIELFQIAADTDAVKAARNRLATMLMV